MRYILWATAAFAAALGLYLSIGRPVEFEPPSARIARACDDLYPNDVDAARRCALHLLVEDVELKEAARVPR